MDSKFIKNYMVGLYEGCQQNYMKIDFFDRLIAKAEEVSWNITVVRSYGNEIIECIEYIKDFNSNVYNRGGKEECLLVASLLLYLVNSGDHNMENYNELYSTESQLYIISTLLRPCQEAFMNYREFKAVNGMFPYRKNRYTTSKAETYKSQENYGQILDEPTSKPIEAPQMINDKWGSLGDTFKNPKKEDIGFNYNDVVTKDNPTVEVYGGDW